MSNYVTVSELVKEAQDAGVSIDKVTVKVLPDGENIGVKLKTIFSNGSGPSQVSLDFLPKENGKIEKSPAKAKKARGRPRKKSVSAEAPANVSPGTAPLPKRRGRPPKSISQAIEPNGTKVG